MKLLVKFRNPVYCGNRHLADCLAGKSPGKVYKSADWNVSVTTQPHSEVSSLAVFQHLLMEGKEFDLEFENPVFEVIPTAHGKNVNIHDENRYFRIFFGIKKIFKFHNF